MGGETYRLQKILELRENEKLQAAKFVASCLEELNQAEHNLEQEMGKLQNCLAKKNEIQDQLDKILVSGSKIETVLQFNNYLQKLKKDEFLLNENIKEYELEISKARKKLEEAERVLILKSNGLKIIENHKSNWITEQIERNIRAEQKLNDENSTTMHQIKKVKSE